MRLKPKSSLNEAISKMADKDSGAASFIALLHKDFPNLIMPVMHSLDGLGLYGKDIWAAFSEVCDLNLAVMIKKTTDGTIKECLERKRRQGP